MRLTNTRANRWKCSSQKLCSSIANNLFWTWLWLIRAPHRICVSRIWRGCSSICWRRRRRWCLRVSRTLRRGRRSIPPFKTLLEIMLTTTIWIIKWPSRLKNCQYAWEPHRKEQKSGMKQRHWNRSSCSEVASKRSLSLLRSRLQPM